MTDRLSLIMPDNLGLGTTISILSLLLDSKTPVTLETMPDYQGSIAELKKIFSIPDSALEIRPVQKFSKKRLIRWSDFAKFFSPYVSNHSVNAMGKHWPVRHTQSYPEKSIAVSWSRNYIPFDVLDQHIETSDEWSHKRYHGAEVFRKVIDKIFWNRFDIVMIDRDNYTLEEKIFLLNQYCSALICYEGGLAHVAHCLNIPVIMLPWRHGHNHWYKLMHMDRRTYFLESVDELLDDRFDLRQVIEDLNRGRNNHPMFRPGIEVDEGNLTLYQDGQYFEDLRRHFTAWEVDFLLTHVRDLRIDKCTRV